MLRHPCIPSDPRHQARGAKTQKGSPTKGNKIRSGSLIPAFSGAKKGPEMLCHPSILGNAQKGGARSNWLPHDYLLGCPNKAGNAAPPLHSQGSPTPSAGSTKSEVVPNKAEQNQNWLPQPCFLGDPNKTRNAMSPLHSPRSPT